MTDQLDLREYVRPGDRIIWGQACGEPRALTELLMAQRASLRGVRVFVGIPADDFVRPEYADVLRFESYCGTGANARLHDAGALEVTRARYSALPHLLAGGRLRADVVFVQVSAPDESGRHSLGTCDDYFSAALETARVVIAEVNEQVPFTYGARTLTSSDWTACVHTSRTPPQLLAAPAGDDARAVARQVAGQVPDGATLQFGIGALPEACLDALADHRDLGIHSGLINEAAMRLMQAGVVTGARKSVDRGVAVGGLLSGSQRLFAFAHRNSALQLRSTSYTHDPQVLANQHRLVAINSAIEVDLRGQVNAEVARGRYVGAVGGATDFLRGAARSPGGVPIIALPSTAGAASRIVPRLSGPVSTAASDIGMVVTEFGSADLRGVPVERRAESLLALAHPDHRSALADAWEGELIKGVRT